MFRSKILMSVILFLQITAVLYSQAKAGEKDNRLDLNDVAAYLSGNPSVGSVEARSLAAGKEYQAYKTKMNNYWKSYQSATVRPIEDWRDEWMPKENHSVCFYPFAGADFMNAYLFFPKARTYILIGLETAGVVPDLAGMNRKEIKKGLSMMVEGYRVFIKWNFYRTLGMAVDLELSPFKGTIPHILAQMGWLGLKPVDVYKAEVDDEGQLITTALSKGEICKNAVIDFIDSDGGKKRIVFLHLDLSNNSLDKEKAWSKYLDSFSSCSGIMKAASYLPPRPEFSTIREMCLKNMDVIVQDDSSIPYKYFKDGWDVKLFGSYNSPHIYFPGYGQKDLKEAYEKAAKISLGFRYSYNRTDDARNMMLATKK